MNFQFRKFLPVNNDKKLPEYGLAAFMNTVLLVCYYYITSVLAYWYLVKYFWLLLPFYGTIKETAVISYGKTKKVQNQTYG